MNWSKVFVLLWVGTAIGCILWFVLFQDMHYFNREVSQEDRHAELVGAKPLPKAPIELVANNKRSCGVIDRLEIDGDSLYVYFHNACSSALSGETVHWTMFAPDGTVIESGYTFTDMDLESGQKGEWHSEDFRHFGNDPRISKIEVKMRYNDEQ